MSSKTSINEALNPTTIYDDEGKAKIYYTYQEAGYAAGDSGMFVYDVEEDKHSFVNDNSTLGFIT